MNFLRKRKPINHYENNYSILSKEVQTKLSYVTHFGFFFKTLRIRKLLGLKGEYLVNKELQELNDTFYAYYDIRFSSSKKKCQIDHIVICHNGIFLLETKLWSSNFTTSYTPFKQLERSSNLFFEKINNNFNHKLHIRKVLISVNGSLEYNSDFKSIYVTSPSKLLKYITSCKRVYSDNEIRMLKDILEKM
jgi:hypothetical protein